MPRLALPGLPSFQGLPERGADRNGLATGALKPQWGANASRHPLPAHHAPERQTTGQDPGPRDARPAHSTISFPRNMPIWQANSYSPGSFGRNSTGTVSPSGSRADLLKAGRSTISLQDADSWRMKLSRTGLPASTTITSGV